MKKRYHTYQLDTDLNITTPLSQRSQRNRIKGFRPAMTEISNSAHFLTGRRLTPHLINLEPEEDQGIQLHNEISNDELKGFAFSCIEALTKLASDDTNRSIQQTLCTLTRNKLTTFVALTTEQGEAKTEYRQYISWSKKFVDTVQPLLSAKGTPTAEANALSQQALQCVERSMGAQFRMNALEERANYLIEAVPTFVKQTGEELGLPSSIMQQIAEQTRKSLIKVAS